jgi:hypothetical protein
VLNSEAPLGGATVTRQVSLNEGESEELCVTVDGSGNVVEVAPDSTDPLVCPEGSEPFAPKEALLGTVGAGPSGIPLKWTDTSGVSTPVQVSLQNGAFMNVNVTENPTRGDTEEWEIYNFTEDAHPIHMHLVRFEVVSREVIGDPLATSAAGQNTPLPWETGYKDTVIAYPDEITTVRAQFDIAGLYVWHCHILEHEDNEMMRPYIVSDTVTITRAQWDGISLVVWATSSVPGGAETLTLTAQGGGPDVVRTMIYNAAQDRYQKGVSAGNFSSAPTSVTVDSTDGSSATVPVEN